MTKKLITLPIIALLASACFGLTAAHASEVTGTLSAGSTGSSVGGTVGGSVSGGSTTGSTVGGTVGGSTGGGGGGGGGGGSVGGSVLGANTTSGGGGSSLGGQVGNPPAGSVLGASTVAPGLPDTGEAPYQTASPWNAAIATVLGLLAISFLAAHIVRKRKGLRT